MVVVLLFELGLGVVFGYWLGCWVLVVSGCLLLFGYCWLGFLLYWGCWCFGVFVLVLFWFGWWWFGRWNCFLGCGVLFCLIVLIGCVGFWCVGLLWWIVWVRVGFGGYWRRCVCGWYWWNCWFGCWWLVIGFCLVCFCCCGCRCVLLFCCWVVFVIGVIVFVVGRRLWRLVWFGLCWIGWDCCWFVLGCWYWCCGYWFCWILVRWFGCRIGVFVWCWWWYCWFLGLCVIGWLLFVVGLVVGVILYVWYIGCGSVVGFVWWILVGFGCLFWRFEFVLVWWWWCGYRWLLVICLFWLFVFCLLVGGLIGCWFGCGLLCCVMKLLCWCCWFVVWCCVVLFVLCLLGFWLVWVLFLFWCCCWVMFNCWRWLGLLLVCLLGFVFYYCVMFVFVYFF